MVKKQIDKRENKSRRIATAIANLKIGETITPTKLFRDIVGIHPDTGKDLLDLHDSLREINFEIFRDEKEEIKVIVRRDEGLDIRKNLREINGKLINLEKDLDEIKTEIKKRK